MHGAAHTRPCHHCVASPLKVKVVVVLAVGVAIASGLRCTMFVCVVWQATLRTFTTSLSSAGGMPAVKRSQTPSLKRSLTRLPTVPLNYGCL